MDFITYGIIVLLIGQLLSYNMFKVVDVQHRIIFGGIASILIHISLLLVSLFVVGRMVERN